MEYLAWNPKAKEVQVHLGSDGFHVTEGLSICFKWSVVWSSKSSRNPVSEGWTGRVCVWQHLLQQISQSGPRRAAISHVWRGVTGSSRAKDCLLALDKWKMLRWASSRRSNLPTPPSWMILMERVDSSVCFFSGADDGGTEEVSRLASFSPLLRFAHAQRGSGTGEEKNGG